MKKFIAGFMCAAMVVACVACGKTEKKETVSESKAETAESAADDSKDLKEINVVLDWYRMPFMDLFMMQLRKVIMKKRGLKLMYSFLQIQMMPCLSQLQEKLK